MSDSSRDKRVSRRRLIWVSLFAAIISLVAFPSDAKAGPLLDWLFQRNRTSAFSGVGSPYAAEYPGGNFSANYNPASQLGQAGLGQAAQAGFGQSGFGQTGLAQGNLGQNSLRQSNFGGGGIFRGQNNSTLFPKCCLFGRGRQAGLASNSNNPANSLAAASADPRTTAGFGGSCETGCQSGWCQQTVLRYVPQIAYRTAYQPVPVTTYKTSTSINPSNGLPRTCTRPCTSYSYQARRVPYTTYRPVYTTVPVADNCGGSSPNPQQQAGFAPQPFAAQTNPQLSGFGSGPACASCQTGNLGAPGYTPGDATFLPPAGQAGPWTQLPQQSAQQSGGFSDRGDVPGATPWRPLRGNFGADSEANDSGIPWQRVDPNNVGGNEADRRPTLRPPSRTESFSNSNTFADDGFGDNQQQQRGSSTRLRAVPMPQDFEETRQDNRNLYDPNRRIDGTQANYRRSFEFQERDDYWNGSQNGSNTDRSFVNRTYDDNQGSRDYFDNEPMDQRMFTTPRQTNRSPYYNSPLEEVNETRRPPVNSYRSRAVRDLDRERRPYSLDDKTAREVSQPQPHNRELPERDFVQSGSRGSRPMLDDEANAVRSSRFAAMPIDWSAVSRTRPVDTKQRSSDWQVR